MTTDIYSRENSFLNITSSSYLNTLLYLPVLGKTLLAILPAAIYGCSGPLPAENKEICQDMTEVTFAMPEPDIWSLHSVNHTDVFIFNDDRLKRLESYQRIETQECQTAKIALLKGDKLIFACANSQENSYSWTDICSRAALECFRADLEYEDPDALVMSGEIRLSTDMTLTTEMPLIPLASCITLSSLRFDFSARPYNKAVISDIKAYLINVNAEYPVSGTYSAHSRIVNAGGMNNEDLNLFRRKENIYMKIADKASGEAFHPNARFLAYPNTCGEETPGTPFTRLVIEATVDSDRYYWPININRSTSGEGNGVERNCMYTYDIVITRKGTDNPDIPVDISGTEINMEVSKWTEKEDYGVCF